VQKGSHRLLPDLGKVGVLGATSMVGQPLLAMLVAAGYEVHAFSRRQILPEQHGVRWHRVNAHGELPEVEIENWICLAKITFAAQQLDYFKKCGVQRIVALSSTSRFTKLDSSSAADQDLANQLRESENLLSTWAENQHVSWVILRLTMVYGFGRDQNISSLVRFIRRFKFFPSLGEMKGLRQPVHAADVAQACLAALQNDKAQCQSFNLSGGDVISYKEMVAQLFLAMGKTPRFIPIPLMLCSMAFSVLRLLSGNKYLTMAIVERMNQDLVFDHSAAVEKLNFAPRRFRLDQADFPR